MSSIYVYYVLTCELVAYKWVMVQFCTIILWCIKIKCSLLSVCLYIWQTHLMMTTYLTMTKTTSSKLTLNGVGTSWKKIVSKISHGSFRIHILIFPSYIEPIHVCIKINWYFANQLVWQTHNRYMIVYDCWYVTGWYTICKMCVIQVSTIF